MIAEDLWARDTIRVLLSSMGCHCVMAASVQQALATINQENPDAAIIDIPGKTSTSSPGLSGLDDLCLGLRGRVIVLTNEPHNAEVAGLIYRYDLPRVRRERLVHELWGVIDSLLRPNSLFRRVFQAARLVFDSFLEPAPEGIRISQPSGRRFVYEAGSLMIDLSLEEPLTDSSRISLVGQLLDSAKPERQLDIFSVALRGATGPIARGYTNQFGEFQFEFDFEPNVELDIATGAKQGVSLILPRLDWLEKGIAGAALAPPGRVS